MRHILQALPEGGSDLPPSDEPSVERSAQVGMDPAYLDVTDRVIANL